MRQATSLAGIILVSLFQCSSSLAARFVEGKIISHKDAKCFAATLHYEAGNQGELGQRMVGHVLLNRIKASGKSVCTLVKHPMQFQFYTKLKKIPTVEAKYHIMALKLLSGYYMVDPTKGSLHFVTKRVYPQLAWGKPVKARYKDHVFF